MNIPFTQEQFLQVFEQYNLSVWPMQIVLIILAITALTLTFLRPSSAHSRVISCILGAFWIWSGAVYHLLNFSTINSPAVFFGILFILQGVLFLVFGVIKTNLRFNYNGTIFNNIGLAIIAYALIFYPLLGTLLGHGYPALPTFGVPCPLSIFTFGILLLTQVRFLPRTLLVIPAIWMIVGSSATFAFGIWEDTGLLVSGITTITLLLIRSRKEANKTEKRG